MSLVKRILVVDDHFETLAIMRAMLEGAAGKYWVRTVPSGEEGMLELRQGGYDLLITDVRLPGMSGIELVRQVRKTQRDLPVIMITGYVSANGEVEARALGVWHYFTKPVAGDVLLTAVHSALSQSPTPSSEPHQTKPEAAVAESPLQHRLEMLQAETGAQGLLLVGIDGAVVFAEMVGMRGQAWEDVVAPLTQLMRSSLELGAAAGSEESFTLQYHDLLPFKLTSASVGTKHFLALFFDAESRRSRIGTVWLFVQRAIADLLGLLTDPPVVEAALAADLPVAERVAAPTAVAVPTPPAPADPIEPELSAAELGQLLGLDMAETAVPEDLDSFWSQAMSETENKKTGMSLAEAQRRGIMPSGLTFEEEVES